MKLFNALTWTGGLLGSGAALAHGRHADVDAGSLLHLLAHNWPLLLVTATVIGFFLASRARSE